MNRAAVHPKFYPAAWAYGLNLILAAVVSAGFMPQKTAAAVAVAGAAVLGLVVAATSHPFVIPLFTAGVGTLLADLAGFGFHLSGVKIAAVTGVLSLVLGVVTHTLVVPNAGSPGAPGPQPARAA